MLENALVAGLCSAGTHVLLTGVLPTAAVAFTTVDEKANAGAVISASHNPVPDNGIKFFSSEGNKISPEIEDEIERLVTEPPGELPVGTDVGTTTILPEAEDRYVRHLLSTLDERLAGMKIVLDLAHGAAHSTAPRAFREAGAEVTVIHGEPDGALINVDCGSTDLSDLAKKVVEVGADVGFGFDGDADRTLAVDESGREVDGDRIIAMMAIHLHERGRLQNDVVVSTVMANLGFRRALQQRGIEVLTAPVGDKYVAEAMDSSGAVLGGEQSGHVIFGHHATTGDGILTALHVAAVAVASDATVGELAHVFEPYPQVLLNVRVASKEALERADDLWEEVRRTEERLGDEGRVLVRPSGTEPIVRVMVEAADPAQARRAAEELAAHVKRTLN
jgi:phosphoglucosamine mutase